MTSYAVGVLALMLLTAAACALPGAFLVSSRQSMLVDAMSHAALPGIVLAALIWPVGSPFLVVGAAVMTLVVVAASELAANSGLMPPDAAQGILFPGLFSLGVILLSTKFAHLHLHEDAVLVGDPNIVAVDHLVVGGVDIGPQYAYVMLGVFLLNALVLWAIHRHLALVVFDPDYAATLGVPVRLVRAIVMLLVAITLTASFYAAGAVLVVAFVVVPAAIASLFARSFASTMVWSVVIALGIVTPVFFGTYYAARPTSSWTAFVFGVVFVIAVSLKYMGKLREQKNAREAV